MAILAPTVLFKACKIEDGVLKPLSGGKLYTYASGTNTPLATYTDATGATPAPNPIILDANGEAPLWLGTSPYKFDLFDSSDVRQANYPIDPIDPTAYSNDALLERAIACFSGSVPPDSPVPGQLWFNTTLGTLNQLNNVSTWEVIPYVSTLGSGFRNLLLNTNGTLINQRGYVSGAATGGANQYTVDRWRVVTSGQNLSWTTTQNNVVFTAPAGGVEQVVEGASIITDDYVINWEGTATCTINGTARAKGERYLATGGVNQTVRFTGGTFSKAQLERGKSASPYEFRPPEQEGALCERYYWKLRSAITGRANAPSGSYTVYQYVKTPVTMRTTPTVTRTVDSSLNAASALMGSTSVDGSQLTVTSAAAGDFYATCSAITFDAEL